MTKFLIILMVLIEPGIITNAQPLGWSIQTSPSTKNLYSVAHRDAGTWIAVGAEGTILRSNDGGIQWTTISSPATDDLRGVVLHGDFGLAVGISGQVVRTLDRGVNWTELPRPTKRNLYTVSISDYMSVACGEEGSILVSLDSGLTWNPHTAGTASVLFGVSVNDSTAVGVGGQGAVVMSTDLGKGWGLTILGNQLTFFYSTSFVSSSTGWAVGSSATTGNVIIHSTDYGFVWNAQTAPTNEQLFGVSFATINSGTAVGGNGTIIHTSNGGINWVSQTSGTNQILNAVSFADSTIGIAVGNSGTILRTSTGGAVSVNKISQYNMFSVYPNPAYDFINLNNYNSMNEDYEINIYNVYGEKIITKAFYKNHQKINVKNLVNGIYMVEIKSKDLSEKQKLLIQR